MSEISKLWAIVQFKPNAHKLAVKNLNQQSFETFLPYEEVTKYKNNKSISTQRPLFPGYMFVAFKKEQAPWHRINCTYGVTKLLTVNNQPYTVPVTLISNIMSKCNSKGVFTSPKRLSKGDSVRVLSGPFGNFLATVETIDKDKRIWVLIDLLGQSARTLVNENILKPSDK